MLQNYKVFSSQAQIKTENYDLIIGHDFKAIIDIHKYRY